MLLPHLAALAFLALSPPETGVDCPITILGHHGGVYGDVVVDFEESQVRTRNGWWASLISNAERGETPLHLTLQPGERFRWTFVLRMACGNYRKYRIVLTHNAGSYTTGTDFTISRNIDLGELSHYFGIAQAPNNEPRPDTELPRPDTEEPRPDTEPGPTTVEDLDLEGEWTRTSSSYDPNDGMRIRVDGNRATIAWRPATAHVRFAQGAVIWQDIEASGELRVLGSDGNYYPAELEGNGPNGLSLGIDHGGRGSVQTWVRALAPQR